MPFHLAPSTFSPARRRALKWFAGAGAAVLAPRNGLVPASAEDATERWALLADTHIDADPAFVSRQGTCMADNLRRVVAEVAAEAGSLAGVIINGDCAYLKGLRGDYEILAGLLRPLSEAGLPVHLTMGNHDDRGPFREAMAAGGTENPPVEGKHLSVIEGPRANWLLLDSLRYVDQVEGEFGEAQLAWLSAYLERNADKPALLAGHHYLQDGGGKPGPDGQPPRITGLVDTEAFRALMERFPQVKAYVFGHSHNWSATAIDGIHQVNLPPTAYVFNPERPSGWVKATVGTGGMTLELRALDTAHPQHGAVTGLEWR